MTTHDTRTALKGNALTTADIVFLVVSAAAPLTVMAGIAPIGLMIGGIGSPLAYTAGGIVLLLFAVGFTAMTRRISRLGGFYVYITESLGRRMGLAAAFLAVVSYNGIQIGLYGMFGSQLSATVRLLTGADIPWWVFAVIGIGLVYLLAARGVDIGARVLGALLILETLILAVLAVNVLVSGGAQGITFGSFTPASVFVPGLIPVMAFGFGAYLGFESTALYREEARSPQTSIPRATYLAIILMGVFYTFMVWIFVIAFGEGEVQGIAAADPAALVFSAIDRYVGPWAQIFMYILIITSIYAALLAFHNAINRYTLALARDGLLPRRLAAVHPRSGSPSASSLLQSGLALIVVAAFALAGADPYLQLLLWVNTPGVLGLILLQGIASIGVFAFLWRRTDVKRRPLILAATALAGVVLITVVVFLCFNLDLLTVGGPLVNGIIIAILPLTLAVGFFRAARLRRTSPQTFARIGGSEA